MTEELKPLPCAHCGMPASIFYNTYRANCAYVEIRCRSCKINLKQRTKTMSELALARMLVERWNRRASPWVRVEDGLPESSDFMAVMDGHETWRRAFYYDGDWYNENEMPVEEVTHWMPIPPLPEQE